MTFLTPQSMPAATHNVCLKYGATGLTVAHPGATPEAHYIIRINNVPQAVSVLAVKAQMERIVILPLDTCEIDWSAIEGKPQGAIIRKTDLMPVLIA